MSSHSRFTEKTSSLGFGSGLTTNTTKLLDEGEDAGSGGSGKLAVKSYFGKKTHVHGIDRGIGGKPSRFNRSTSNTGTRH